MSEKITVKDFNSLQQEERKKISYYTNEQAILTLCQVMDKHGEDMTPRLKKALRRWIKNLVEWQKENYITELQKE